MATPQDTGVGSGVGANATDSALLDEIENILARRTKQTEQKASESEKETIDGYPLPDKWRALLKEEPLFSQTKIESTVKSMASTISSYYKNVAESSDEPLLCVALLNGAFVFAADLTRQLTVPYQMDFISASSYHGTKSSGSIQLHRDIIIDPKDRHVLILEDLSDTGRTVMWIRKHIQSKGPKSVKIAVLLDKHKCRVVDGVELDFVGQECPDEFVVGYGMDFNEDFRCLPFIGVLKPEAYAK